jgi:hypothetical protein
MKRHPKGALCDKINSLYEKGFSLEEIVYITNSDIGEVRTLLEYPEEVKFSKTGDVR